MLGAHPHREELARKECPDSIAPYLNLFLNFEHVFYVVCHAD